MLPGFMIVATAGAGFANGPWWFWIVAGAALAFLSITDPYRLRPSFAILGDSGTLALSSLISLTTGCLTSALAFATGRIASWLLPL